MKLLVVLPFCRSDLQLAENLLDWIEELGRCEENDALLVRDCKLTDMECSKLYSVARRCFKSVKSVATPFELSTEKWPIGPNWMFETALRHLTQTAGVIAPWLWLEPDCVPMRSTWLGEIERIYTRNKALFMGQVVVPDKQGLPERMLSGVAVYPGDKNVLDKLLKITVQNKTRRAWDVAMTDLVLPMTSHTKLIWNFIGEKGLPPTFVKRKTSGQPRNAMTLEDVPRATGLFHRCKDGTLISLLRKDTEATIPQLCMAFKLQVAIEHGEKASYATTLVTREPLRLFHAVEMHSQRDKGAQRRTEAALRSWERLYKAGKLKPAHVWECDYPRDAREVGDERALPYVKDVLIPAMTCARDKDDVILWTNNDTILHPLVLDAIEEKLQHVSACGSFRVNFNKVEKSLYETEPNVLAQRGVHDLGRDLFAFKKRWLLRWWNEIPDFFLGEVEFDLVLAVMIRRDAGVFTTKLNWEQLIPACEIDKGYVLHEIHDRSWTSDKHKNSAAKMWNRDRAIEFYAKNGMPSLISNF